MTATAVATDEPAGGRRGLSPVVAAALAVLLGLALGFAAGVYWAKPSHPGEDSADAGFARDMSVHHAQAVEMAMIAWQKGTLPEVRTVGYDIATTQQTQIGLMRGWLDKWGVSPTSTEPAMSWMDHGEHMLEPDGRMKGMASHEQIEELKAAQGSQVDILFCKLMIAHHNGGITMAEEAVKDAEDEEVRALAQGMVDVQASEIKLLRDLMAKAEAAA